MDLIEKNNTIRDELKQWLEITGRKSIYVCKQVDLSPTTISLFLNNKRDLPSNRLELIDFLIHS